MTTLPQTERPNPEHDPFTMSNFTTRLITALILLPVALFGMYVGGGLWLAMMTLIGVVGLLEFYMMAQGQPMQGNIPVGVLTVLVILGGFYLHLPVLLIAALGACGVLAYLVETQRVPRRLPLKAALMTLAGVLYVGLPVAFLVSISNFEDGFAWLLVVFVLTWGTDTFAYFGGRLFGKRKLAPKLSPNKTIEGAVVGVLGGFGAALVVLLVADIFSLGALVMIGVAPFIGVIGDLLESGLKRFFHVKDSHLPGLNLVPGHGGVLDRIDALILVTLFCYPMMVLLGIAG